MGSVKSTKHRWDWVRQEGVDGLPAQVYACTKCGWEKTVGRRGTSFHHVASGKKFRPLQWAIETPKCGDPKN